MSPFSLRRYFEPGDLELVVPFISVTSDGQTIVVNGVPNRRGKVGPSDDNHSSASQNLVLATNMVVEGPLLRIVGTHLAAASRHCG